MGVDHILFCCIFPKSLQAIERYEAHSRLTICSKVLDEMVEKLVLAADASRLAAETAIWAWADATRSTVNCVVLLRGSEQVSSLCGSTKIVHKG